MNTGENKRKNKIGARRLSEKEARLILPAYDQIYDQIAIFREEKISNTEESVQKTNNIGIMGVRGAGKTSILKTIREELKRQNKEGKEKNIILPIIVPENMSESSTLMATILGMLSETIDDITEDEKKKRKREEYDCKNKLRVKYNEVIKQYTFIQKEYRNILLREYTTENDYVRRSAEVFNSDTEFIKKFNDLVNELVNPEGKDKKSEKLLFLFIDDIDLSTYRCTDVVKTLLSYLSNENIVTFISGDLDTFEEALTLDFIRRENILERDILDREFGNKTLLKSKKDLSYEYLKKIIPPAYRYNIKHWSLEERGNYYIADSTMNEEVETKLSELLDKALKGWIDPAFFSYYDASTNEKQVLPYTYHLFDDTSRGLNNVYNILNDIVAKRSAEERKNENDTEKKVDIVEKLTEKKLLIDTIVSSNKIYNQYREYIQKRMITVGIDEEHSKVFFDNALAIIYKKKGSENKEKDVQQEKKYNMNDPVERFSLFILVDFAARLLYENEYAEKVEADESYVKLKRLAMQDLFFNPVIAEKVMDFPGGTWKGEINIDEKYGDPLDRVPQYAMNLYDLNRSFLLKGDLVLNLAYYKNLPINRMTGMNAKEKQYPVEFEHDIIIMFWNALTSIAHVDAKSNEVEKISVLPEAVMYYPVFWKEFTYIQSRISSLHIQNVVIWAFDKECEEAVKKYKGKEAAGGEEWEIQRMNRVLLNTIAELIKPWVNDKGKNNDQVHADDDDTNKRIEILRIIDSQKLWNAEAAGVVVDHLEEEIIVTLNKIIEILRSEGNGSLKLNIKMANDSWQVFKDSYDGETQTKAYITKMRILELLRMNDPESSGDFEKDISYQVYDEMCRLLADLASNNHVWYGRYESQRVLIDLQKAFIKLGENTEWQDLHINFVFFLQCLYNSKCAKDPEKKILEKAKLLADITAQISKANQNADKEALGSFVDKLNMGLSTKISSSEFDRLFPR